jgi:flagellar export protein FliJ
MKAFNFPLESLRTLRKQREQAAQQRYAQALVACDGAQRLLQLADEEMAACQVLQAAELKTGATAGRIVQLQVWSTVLRTRRAECQTRLDEAQRNANDAFRLMTAAVRERESLDHFHDKSQRIWQRAFHAEEQKMFDELAVQRQSVPAIFEKPLLN